MGRGQNDSDFGLISLNAEGELFTKYALCHEGLRKLFVPTDHNSEHVGVCWAQKKAPLVQLRTKIAKYREERKLASVERPPIREYPAEKLIDTNDEVRAFVNSRASEAWSEPLSVDGRTMTRSYFRTYDWSVLMPFHHVHTNSWPDTVRSEASKVSAQNLHDVAESVAKVGAELIKLANALKVSG